MVLYRIQVFIFSDCVSHQCNHQYIFPRWRLGEVTILEIHRGTIRLRWKHWGARWNWLGTIWHDLAMRWWLCGYYDNVMVNGDDDNVKGRLFMSIVAVDDVASSSNDGSDSVVSSGLAGRRSISSSRSSSSRSISSCSTSGMGGWAREITRRWLLENTSAHYAHCVHNINRLTHWRFKGRIYEYPKIVWAVNIE